MFGNLIVENGLKHMFFFAFLVKDEYMEPQQIWLKTRKLILISLILSERSQMLMLDLNDLLRMKLH